MPDADAQDPGDAAARRRDAAGRGCWMPQGPGGCWDAGMPRGMPDADGISFPGFHSSKFFKV